MNCLLCYKTLAKTEIDYHAKCVMRIFSTKQIPEINIDEKKLDDYVLQY